MPAGVVIAKYI